MSPAARGLVLVEQGGRRRELGVPASGQVVLGSDPGRAGLLLEAEGVAGEHCRIGRLVRGGYALRDLGSPGGTLVNGERVESKRLGHGDRIEVGTARLLVVDPALEPLPTGTPAREEAEPEELVLPSAEGARDRSEVGCRIPGYRILRTLGRGAFGRVLLAVQESLERETALKLLSPELEHNEEFVRRFQEEARAAASLAHPNVVVVYDVGEADGHHFLSMEYMALGSLEDRLGRDGSLPWPEVLGILIDAARGLVYAEQRGIVHRDIKPANLMQTAAGVTKIADLGLAVSQDAAAKAGAHGTAHFVSPEQARGEPVDQRSDLYSLGATAFRLLTGRTPFEGSNKREILRAVFEETPPLVTELAPDTPMELALLLARLLAKDPDDRPASARQLLFELEHLRARAAVPLSEERPRGTAWKLALGILPVLAAAMAAIGYLGREREPALDREPKLAETRPPLADFPEPPGVAEPDVEPEQDPGSEPADDRALALLEDRARGALIALEAVGDDSARAAGLRNVVARYRGTSAAAEAAERLARLEARAVEREPTDPRRADREAVLGELRRGTGVDGEDFSLASALSILRRFEPPLPLLGDPRLEVELQQLRRDLVTRALRDAQAALDQARDRADAGDFAGAAEVLEQGREHLGARGPGPAETAGAGDAGRVPAPTTGAPELDLSPELADALRAADRRLDARRDELELEEQAWREARLRSDRVRFLAGLHAGAGLEEELAALDLGAARARLDGVAAELETESTRALARSLSDELASYENVLAVLSEELEAGTWRRRSILDPRQSRFSTRQIVGTSLDGWLLAGDPRPELLPHQALARSSAGIDGLFHARLRRDYTPAELAGIAAGVRIAAVLETLDRLAPAFERSPPALEEVDTEALDEAFRRASEWEAQAGVAPAARAEREAVRRFVGALEDSAAGAWTSAESELDAMLEEGAGTLFVMLLSEGDGDR